MLDLIVTGASGFLGSHIVQRAAASGRGVLGVYHAHPVPVDVPTVHLDISDSRALMDLIRTEKPAAVIHTGALTSPDYCEMHREEATAVNLTATGALAMAAFAVDAHLIFVSTDLVFDGRNGMYTESDVPNPLNHYAQTKAQAEHLVRAASTEFAVVRPSFIYGRPLSEHQASFSESVFRNLLSGTGTTVFNDQYRSPIEAGVLAAALLEISDRRLGGMWHVAGSDRLSRADFARLLASAGGLDPGPLREVSMFDIPLAAQRPQDVSLDTSKARGALISAFPDTEQSLRALYSPKC